MKKAIGFGVCALLVGALSLGGCSGSERERQTSAGDGTNTGNGSCLPPWCSYPFPHVATAEDGATYAGVLDLTHSAFPRFEFTGDAVMGGVGNCELVPNRESQFGTTLELVTIDPDGSMRFRATDPDYAEADLTLTQDLDVSGTVTARFTFSNGGARMIGLTGPNPSGGSTWTRTFTIHGKTSVWCEPGEDLLLISFEQGPSSTQVQCYQQPSPPGYTGCNDTGSPSP